MSVIKDGELIRLIGKDGCSDRIMLVEGPFKGRLLSIESCLYYRITKVNPINMKKIGYGLSYYKDKLEIEFKKGSFLKYKRPFFEKIMHWIWKNTRNNLKYKRK